MWFDWKLLSKESLHEIIYKVGLDWWTERQKTNKKSKETHDEQKLYVIGLKLWNKMDDNTKAEWISNKLDKDSYSKYESEYRNALSNQDDSNEPVDGGRKRRITKKKLNRKRKMTRSKRR